MLGTRHRMKTGKTTTKSTYIYRKLRNEQTDRTKQINKGGCEG
jgi:hypothetical protein